MVNAQACGGGEGVGWHRWGLGGGSGHWPKWSPLATPLTPWRTTKELWLHSLGLLAMLLHIQVLALPLPIGGTSLP